jgi:hypothetical protein
MASTYSDLKIELIATGEQSGTWGTTTNTNLGTALEEAITGSADVSFSSGTVTLSLTNTNATQAARNLRLNLTGTSGGAQNLIVPAIEKLYLIKNGVADTITVKNSSGTGIAVPAGKSMFVYNDGSNVVDAVTHLTSLTLGSALPVASGGTGATSNAAAAFALKGANSDITSLSGLTTALTVAQGGTGAATHTANAVLIGEGTGAITSVSPGASGNVLSSDGTNWTSAAAAAFDSGTKMVFQQTAAPTGWTKETTHDNKAFRVVTGTAGTGGTVNFTTAFTSQTVSISGTTGSTSAGGSVGNHTLATNRIPSHTHPSGGKPATLRVTTNPKGGYATSGVNNTGSAGGGAAHNHPFSGSSHNHSFSDTDSVDLAVQYVDLIIAAKD